MGVVGRYVEERASVFRASQAVDGWIEATGLYRAMDGDTLKNVSTVDEQIAARAVIVGKGGVPMQ